MDAAGYHSPLDVRQFRLACDVPLGLPLREPLALPFPSVVVLTNATEPSDAALVNQGTLIVLAGTTFFNGSFSNEPTGLLRVQSGAAAQPATLTVAQGFTNQGALELTNAANAADTSLNILSGTLVNAAGATPSALAGGNRFLNAPLDNRGTVVISATLFLNQPSADGLIDVQGGLLTVNQSGATASFVNNGTITASSTLFINQGASHSVTNNGTLNVRGNVNVAIIGGQLANLADNTLTGGTYNVEGTFRFPDATIVRNAARVVLDGLNARITNQSGGIALGNFAENTAAGSFTLRNGGALNRFGTFTNSGQFILAAGAFTATFNVIGSFLQTGGTTTVGSGATLTSNGGVTILAGLLAGSGTVNGNVTNSGQVAPGGAGAAGTLRIMGTYTQTATGLLTIEVGGLTAGTGYDVLVVTGLATLDGTLTVTLINGFSPGAGAAFRVLTFGSRGGAFATIDGDGPLFTAVYNPTDLTLVAG